MSRIQHNGWLYHWDDGDNPGAGPKGTDSTGLNGQWYKIDVAVQTEHNINGTHKSNIIDKQHLKVTVCDGTTLEKDNTAGLRVKAGGISSQHIAAGAVQASQIATGAVNTNHLADYSITPQKLADESVPERALQFQSVTKSKISTGAVSPDKFEYKEYVALLTQSGSNDPTATVVSNTLGEIISWSRVSTGTFIGSVSTDIFTVNKTVWVITNGTAFCVAAMKHAPGGLYIPTRQLQLITYNAGGAAADSLLNSATVVVRVYP